MKTKLKVFRLSEFEGSDKKLLVAAELHYMKEDEIHSLGDRHTMYVSIDEAKEWHIGKELTLTIE